MGKQQSAILGAALLILGAVGVWIWSSNPEPGASNDTAPEQEPDLHARALLRVEASIAGKAADHPEVLWLVGELRYLLIRGQVALARPQGPYDPEDGSTVFTLRVTAPEDPEGTLQLALITPRGQPEREAKIPPRSGSRLGRLQALAGALPPFLPRGDTGVEFAAFLGTEVEAAYESLAQARMAAVGSGELLQSQITTRDTPVDLLETLVRQQPDFARAWSELALLYLSIDGKDAASLTAIAERSAKRALALDPRLADANAVVGIAQQRRGEWLPADANLALALSLDPASPVALEAFSCLLIDVGRVRYATLIGEQAVAVAPLSEQAAECLAYARLAAGDLPAADTPSELARRPKALVALLAGRTAEARQLLAPPDEPPQRFASWFAAIERAIDRPEQRPEALRVITRAASDGVLDPATEIVYGAALRQPDFVFNRLLRLEGQNEEAPARILWVRDAPFLREHPRFAGITQSLGLDAYWKEREKPDLCGEQPQFAICR